MKFRTKELGIPVLIVIVALAIIGGGLTGAAVKVPTTETHFCYKQVPRTVYEQVCEDKPYACNKPCQEEKVVIEEVPLLYSVTNKWVSDHCFWSTCSRVNVQIFNRDKIGGEFEVTFTIKKYDGSILTYTAPKRFIKPYEYGTISAGDYKFGIDYWSYEVLPSTKEEPKTKVVSSICADICYKQECRIVEKIKYVDEKSTCSKTEIKSLGEVVIDRFF